MSRGCTNTDPPCRGFPEESAPCLKIGGADLCTLPLVFYQVASPALYDLKLTAATDCGVTVYF